MIHPGKILLLLLLFWGTCSAYAAGDHGETHAPTGPRSLPGDTALIYQACKSAKECLLVHANPRGADSLSEIAIDAANASYNNTLILEALNGYMESTDHRYNYEKTMDYATRAEALALVIKDPDIRWRTYINIASVYRSGYQYDKAMSFSFKSFDIASNRNNTGQKVRSYLSIGQSQEGKNQKIEAFRNYLNALNLAEKLGDKTLLLECYERLSMFYLTNKIYDKAINFRLKHIETLTVGKDTDSTALMWSLYELESISFNANREKLNDGNIQRILQFANSSRNIRMKNYVMGLYRAHLIQTQQFGKLKDLYVHAYPHELEYLREADSSMYFRLQAFFQEADGKTDSARHYFDKARQIVETNPNKIFRSNFFIRYGEFAIRKRDINSAIQHFSLAYQFAEEASFFDYMLESSRYLDSLYALTTDYANAYKFASINRKLSDSLALLTKVEDLLKLELESEETLNEIARQRQAEHIRQRHSLQYTVIVILLASTLVLLALMGNFKVPSWYIRVFGFLPSSSYLSSSFY